MSTVAVLPVCRPTLTASSSALLRAKIELSLGEDLAGTLLLRERTIAPALSTGVPTLDALTGGLPRGGLSEVSGSASSGRTGVMLRALATATQQEEVCALVDASDSFDPASASAAGVNLNRLLWVRCGERKIVFSPGSSIPKKTALSAGTRFAFSHALERVLKVTDLLLQGGGFGMVVLDLGDIPVESVRRIPLTSWFRFRRVVEPTATVLLLVEQEPCAKTCASLVLRLQAVSICTSSSTKFPCRKEHFMAELKDSPAATASTKLVRLQLAENANGNSGAETQQPRVPKSNIVGHADLLQGMESRAEVLRWWRQRKPPQSVDAQFELRFAL